MKSLFKIFVALLITVGFLNAQALEQNGEKNGYDINLSSQKSVIVGNNSFDIKLSKDGVAITDAKVKLKVFMPEMPGMPYMESESEATLVGKVYKLNINLPMGGTWQYQLKFKTEDGVIHTIKGSVNL